MCTYCVEDTAALNAAVRMSRARVEVLVERIAEDGLRQAVGSMADLRDLAERLSSAALGTRERCEEEKSGTCRARSLAGQGRYLEQEALNLWGLIDRFDLMAASAD
jgi:hypothetical protein